MKIFNILSASLSLFAISPSFACLHTYGEVHSDTEERHWTVVWAGATDNGLDVCDTAWGNARIDQDGHFSIPCLPGYVYAFTEDGLTAWYSNGINAFRFAQSPSSPEGGYDWTWQTYNFGC